MVARNETPRVVAVYETGLSEYDIRCYFVLMIETMLFSRISAKECENIAIIDHSAISLYRYTCRAPADFQYVIRRRNSVMRSIRSRHFPSVVAKTVAPT